MQQQLWIEYHQQPVKTPYLDEYTDDLTAEAKADPDRFKAIGREQEIEGNEISDALSDIFYDGFSDVDSGKNAGKKVVVLS